MTKMTNAQGRIALDLSRTTAERCKQVMLDSMSLCDHPLQQWSIGMQIAAQSLGAASGALRNANPEISYDEAMEAAFALLKGMVQGNNPLSGRQALRTSDGLQLDAVSEDGRGVKAPSVTSEGGKDG